MEELNYFYLTTIAFAGLTLLVLVLLGWPRAIGLRSRPRGRAMLYILLPVAFPLFRAAGVREYTAEMWGGWIFLALLVAFHEEVVFRGLLLRVLLRGGTKKAVTVSALLFGVFHLLSPLYGATMTQSLFYWAWATCLGLVFGALRVRTASLWPPIIVHMLYNVVGYTSVGTRFDFGLIWGGIPVDLVVAGPLLAGYGWLCLRGSGDPEDDE
ncbi:MAG: lysostaphin resistance A-like protein [Planctomycetota bacterium]